MTPRQRFAHFVGVPRIETFVDPAVVEGASGAVHDATWVIECSFDDTPMACLLDGTVRPTATEAVLLRQFAEALPRSYPLAVVRGDVAGPGWLAAWSAQRAAVVEDRDPDVLARLCVTGGLGIAPDAPQTVLVVAGSHGRGIATPGSLARLRELLPNVRPVLGAIRALPEELEVALAAVDGGHVQFGTTKLELTRPYRARCLREVELAIAPGRDAYVEHAQVRRPPLRDRDTLAVRALAPHVDEPVFVATLRGYHAEHPMMAVAYHTAHRTTHAPTRAQLEAATAPWPDVPACEWPPDAAALDGDLVLEAPHRPAVRLPLRAAQRLRGTVAIADLRVIDGALEIMRDCGAIRIDGIQLATNLWTGIPRGALVEIEDAIVRATLRSPRVGAAAEAARLLIDGQPIELREDRDGHELWFEGQRLAVYGRHNGDRVRDTRELSWLAHATREAPLAGESGQPIDLAGEMVTGWLTVDLARGIVLFDVVERVE